MVGKRKRGGGLGMDSGAVVVVSIVVEVEESSAWEQAAVSLLQLLSLFLEFFSSSPLRRPGKGHEDERR